MPEQTGQITMSERLTKIEERLTYLTQRIDEVVVTQLKDHGKRLSSLESRQVWLTGWVAGAAVLGAAALYLLERMGKI